MKFKNLPFGIALTVATILVVGCGDKDEGLTAADKAWIKQERIKQMYGISGTVTNTSTVTQTVTITNSTTVVAH